MTAEKALEDLLHDLDQYEDSFGTADEAATFKTAHEAEQAYKKAVELAEQLLGQSDEGTLSLRDRWAVSLRDDKNIEGAIACNRETVRRYIEAASSFGSGNDFTLEAQRRLAGDFLIAGQFKNAVDGYREIVETVTAAEKDYITICQDRNNYSEALLASGTAFNTIKAFEEGRKVLGIAEDKLGLDHIEGIRARYNLGEKHLRRGRFNKALEMLAENVSIMEKDNCQAIGHPDYPRLLEDSRKSQATCLRRIERQTAEKKQETTVKQTSEKNIAKPQPGTISREHVATKEHKGLIEAIQEKSTAKLRQGTISQEQIAVKEHKGSVEETKAKSTAKGKQDLAVNQVETKEQLREQENNQREALVEREKAPEARQLEPVHEIQARKQVATEEQMVSITEASKEAQKTATLGEEARDQPLKERQDDVGEHAGNEIHEQSLAFPEEKIRVEHSLQRGSTSPSMHQQQNEVSTESTPSALNIPVLADTVEPKGVSAQTESPKPEETLQAKDKEVIKKALSDESPKSTSRFADVAHGFLEKLRAGARVSSNRVDTSKLGMPETTHQGHLKTAKSESFPSAQYDLNQALNPMTKREGENIRTPPEDTHATVRRTGDLTLGPVLPYKHSETAENNVGRGANWEMPGGWQADDDQRSSNPDMTKVPSNKDLKKPVTQSPCITEEKVQSLSIKPSIPQQPQVRKSRHLTL
ncbi:hypothetical protein P154DRAFT_616244 [Amniculicola lignicola CBS 123094]|uniref:Uncharacterized protein n=1 Tax=Amniculicola lignicola CBS 123094 TaxID=1392246 RepID=A0A6A5WWA8_9PLEO|nr:hypothetical protein P154DRAFT_616244 [Amniculicola lignicola CBS 123094]